MGLFVSGTLPVLLLIAKVKSWRKNDSILSGSGSRYFRKEIEKRTPIIW